MVDLSIVIVSWNVKEKLRENLHAIFASRGNFSFEVYVIDNNSQDGSADMVEEEFKEATLIANKENLGFAQANNQGVAEAMRIHSGRISKFLLLLNPDMQVKPNTLVNMVKWMNNHPQAAVASCRLVTKHGRTVKNVRCFPHLWDQLMIVLKVPHISRNILNKYLLEDFDYSQEKQVSSIRGGFFMINNQVIKIRPFLDEQYFLWFEEVDFCRHIYKYKGSGEVWYTPVAECIDYVGQSFKQLPRGRAQDYFRDSQLKYFKKWHPIWQYWLLKMAWPLGKFLAKTGEKAGIKSKAKT